jgi:hypothetical protein
MALVGGVLWFAWRAFKRQVARVAEELHRNEKPARDVATLERGEDGVYRPRDPHR